MDDFTDTDLLEFLLQLDKLLSQEPRVADHGVESAREYMKAELTCAHITVLTSIRRVSALNPVTLVPRDEVQIPLLFVKEKAAKNAEDPEKLAARLWDDCLMCKLMVECKRG